MKLLCSAAFTSSLLPLGFANACHHMNASCSLEPNKSYPLTMHAHLNAYIASSTESTELFPGLPCFVLESGWSFYLYSHWLSALSLFHHPFLSFHSPFSFLQLPHTATIQVCVHGSEALYRVSTRSDERMSFLLCFKQTMLNNSWYSVMTEPSQFFWFIKSPTEWQLCWCELLW